MESIDFGPFRCCRLRLQNPLHTARAPRIITTSIATPTPIPIFAPVLRPEEAEVDGGTALEVDAPAAAAVVLPAAFVVWVPEMIEVCNVELAAAVDEAALSVFFWVRLK
jgi:hypothetical protein